MTKEEIRQTALLHYSKVADSFSYRFHKEEIEKEILNKEKSDFAFTTENDVMIWQPFSYEDKISVLYILMEYYMEDGLSPARFSIGDSLPKPLNYNIGYPENDMLQVSWFVNPSSTRQHLIENICRFIEAKIQELKKIIKKNNTPTKYRVQKTFSWQQENPKRKEIQLKKLHKAMIDDELIAKETVYNDFQIIFSGEPKTNVNRKLQWIDKNSKDNSNKKS